VSQKQPNNPLHGIKLKQIVQDLADYYGWEQLSNHIDINCFKNDPSINSSLKFLRKHQWARDQVEELWVKACSN
tara:strand:+ start:24115 stop:24336 length:222 start_codon:yes stop_codon:yes gene_type:complete